MVPVYYLCNQVGIGLRASGSVRESRSAASGSESAQGSLASSSSLLRSFTMRLVQLRVKLVQLLACPVTMTTYTGT